MAPFLQKLKPFYFLCALFLSACRMAGVPSQRGAELNAEAAFSWAVFPSTVKIFPDTLPQGDKEARIYGAIDEYVSFQIALRSKVEVTLPVKSPFDTFEVFYIDTPGVAAWGYSRKEYTRPVYPDPLLPAREITLRPGETRSLWIRTRVKESLRTAVVVGDISVPVLITAWDWEMPQSPSLQTSIGLESEGLARFYDTSRGSDRFKDIYKLYYDALLDYRLSAYHLPYSLDDSRAEKYMTDPRVTTFRIDRGLTPQLWDKINSIGAQDKSWVLNFDEPKSVAEYENITSNAAGWHGRYSGIRYGMTFYDHSREGVAPFDSLSGSVNLWALQTDYFARVHTEARERYEAGDEIWLYTALAPREGWCNILINHTALEHRLLFWQLFSEEIVSGYLYWHAAYWDQVDDPWTDQATVKNLDSGLWGDGSLFYPLPDGPAGSIRLELIRAGLQDYELLEKAEAVLGRDELLEYLQPLTRDFTDYTSDYELFEDVRIRLGEIIDKR